MSDDTGTGLGLVCTGCSWFIILPEGTPVSALRSDCPECHKSVQIRSIDPDTVGSPETQSLTGGELIGFEFLPLSFDDEDISALDFADNPEHDDADSKTISGFVNRMAPIVLAVHVIADMMRSGVEVNEETVLEKFTETSVSYRKALQRVEVAHSISRGLRLSDGFPKDNEESIRRFTRVYLGADPDKGHISEQGGLSQHLGLIALEYTEGEQGLESAKVNLTRASETILSIELYRRSVLETETHRAAGANPIKLPRWMSKEDVGRIIHLITERSNAEYGWLRDLLYWINAKFEGRTTDELCDLEIEEEMIRRIEKRWFRRGSNIPLVEEMRKENDSEEDISKELGTKISATLGGTLSRMKELSLIYPFKRGRQTYYKATKSGAKWVKRWDMENQQR